MTGKDPMQHEPKEHRPYMASAFALAGVAFYAMSLFSFSTVHYIVVSAGYGALVLSIIWFSLSAICVELAFEFHARRVEKKTLSIIAAVLLLDFGAITTGGIGLWLAVRFPHYFDLYAIMHGLFTFIWFAIAAALFGTALHVIHCHTPKRKIDEASTKRLSTSGA